MFRASTVLVNSHGSVVTAVFGVVIIWVVLLDAFETVVLPRRVTRHFKLTAWFYRQTWIPWRNVARHIKTASRQQNFLGYFGPLSLILLPQLRQALTAYPADQFRPR